MMGDGIIEIRRLRAAVEEQGFDGFVEVEIFSERWWREPIADVIETCIARHRSVV
jgi:sugar phosphate isomerase/epimerase